MTRDRIVDSVRVTRHRQIPVISPSERALRQLRPRRHAELALARLAEQPRSSRANRWRRSTHSV
jgi:hypothetical protein